ncbi:MAG: response regulator transcription factor [Alphaproteobacteria bacterium]|uniref:Cell cycle response regulator CtrA n=1 Tax=Candidatus Bodocaedibacter vickermanii TaxID=2741701 RepID=A0A7L9RUW3_9PROT|nr:response regulator transcription factor [Alphaproteobacteria bacterium]QOL20299.1 Cell cycle response regulator CtrA [Candidatus Paracaedibacteraceae bacterium 'Lake Konstanz']
MRVLLIEDDPTVSKSVELMLQSTNIVCDVTNLGEEGIEISKLYDYDIIILDLMLPDMDGFDVIKRLRNAAIKTPILILSGLSEADDKIKGFGIGADDYLTKPFNKNELVARINAIVRRARGHADATIKIGRLVINLQSHTAEVDGEGIPLTSKEYAILELLAMRKGSTLTKEMFLNHLYGGLDEPELKIIDVFVCKLRKKLSKALNGDCCIETIWGRGYVLRGPQQGESDSSISAA